MKKIWMTTQTQEKKHNASIGLWKTLFFIIFFCTIFLFLQLFLLEHGLFTPALSTILVLLMTALVIGYAIRSGNRMVSHVYVFFLTEEHELFYADARSRQRPSMNDGVLGAIETYADADKVLQKIKSTGEIPELARKVLWVKNIRERSQDASIVCRVQTQKGSELDETLFVSYQLPDIQSLMLELEARKRANGPEARADKNLPRMFISLVFMIGFCILCFLSHPYQAYLPDNFYYPSMALTVVALWFFLYYFLKHQRGEK